MKNANYFAVIPAPILFDKELSPIEKVLFAHLSVLSEKEGYAFANNKYLAEQIDRSPEHVSKILSKIEKKGFISIFYKDTKRLIYLEIGVVKNDKGGCQKGQGGVVINDKHNINNININNLLLEKQGKKIEKNFENDFSNGIDVINDTIQTYEEFVKCLNQGKLMSDFFYKIGSQQAFSDFTMNFWLFTQEKRKILNAKTAEISFRRYLKPTWESEEDRQIMIAEFEKKRKRSQLSQIAEKEKKETEDKMRQSDEKMRERKAIFESFLNDDGKKFFISEAEKWINDNVKNSFLLRSKQALIINKALQLFDKVDRSQIDLKFVNTFYFANSQKEQ